MNTTYDKTAALSGTSTCLDTIRMSEHKRRQARASLRHAELIADLLLRAIARGFEHFATGLTAIVKAIFARPVKH